jgi:uncharacterized delta-60 repeat protein
MARNLYKRQSRGGSLAGRRLKKGARRRNRFGRFTELGVEHLEDRRLLAAGDLDTTFDVDGWVSASFEANDDLRITSMAMQNDGKILIAGQFNNQQVIVARFNANGVLDATFGDNDGVGGYTRFAVNGHQSFAEDITIDNANGDIYLVGRGANVANTATGFAVMRLDSDGELDASFGAGGVVVTHFAAGAGAEARGVALQSDGKIVVVGVEQKTATGSTRNDFAVARYNRDGSLDTTFDVDGKLITTFSGANALDEAFDVAIQQVGAYEKILVSGYSSRPVTFVRDFTVVRYNPDGSLDTTSDNFDAVEFGAGGITTTPVAGTETSIANAVTIDLAGRIVVAGTRNNSSTSSDVTVARYTANGILDTTFNPTGAPTPGSGTTLPGTVRINYANSDFGSSIVVQSDGKYLIGATVQTTSGTPTASYRFGLARINTNGTLDTTFGTGGLVQAPAFNETGVPTDPDLVRLVDLALQPNGKIVASGWVDFETTPSLQGDYLMARYHSGLTVNSIAGYSEVDEGAAYTLYLNSTDPVTQWTIDWGDGFIENVAGSPSTVTHVYADGHNNYVISATRTNGSGTVAAGSQAVSVKNVNPLLEVNNASVIADEGMTATNSGTFGDVPADTVTVVASIGSVTQNAGVWNWSYHTTDDFNGPVTITATDEDGGVTVATFNLEVKNINPTVTVDQASVIAEVSQTVTNSGAYSDVPADSIMLIASIGTVVNNNDGTWTWSYTTGMVPPEQTVTIAAIDDNNGFGMVTFSLSVDPTLTAAPDQVADEGTPVNITDIGTFTDIVQAGNAGWPVEIGLDANDFSAIGVFDPSSSVVFDTDTLAVSGGFSGVGAVVTANTGHGNYQIAVFTFDDFELDAGITITATGSRPIAILSQGNMSIAGIIDVSARSNGLPGVPYEQLAGPGGGNGGLSGSTVDNGDPAAGAPANSAGQYTSGFGSGGGAGGGFGGRGGRAETNPLGGLQNIAQVGQAFANLAAGIQGGSGGATGSAAFSGTFSGGGGGGGGIELGAVGVLTVASDGQILANGGDGSSQSVVSTDGTGGGGAGGGILLHATNVNQHGTLEAKGGNGGGAPRNGGGGGGGAILIVHNASGSFNNTGGTQSVIGGTSGPGSGGESGVVGVFAMQSDTPPATPVIETFDYVIDWGDGSSIDTNSATIDTPGVNIGDVVLGSFDGSHTYAENGVYTVTVTLNDSNGGSDASTFTVTVNNVDPALAVDQAAISVDEGQTATNSGTYGDVPADFVSISASVGNLVDNGNGTWSWSFNSTDGPVESQLVTITATDEDGGLTQVTFDLTVNNLDPTLTVGQAAVVGDEGQSVTNSGTYGDVPADAVSVTASIGVVVFAAGVWNWSYSAADDLATQSVTITATDEDGGLTQVTFNLTIDNVDPALTVDQAAVVVNEGQTATNSGTYSDVPADTVTLMASAGAIIDNNDGTWSWSFAGTDDLATLTVTITASDEDGGLTIATFDLTVNNAAPSLTVGNASVTISEGQTATNTGTYADVPADTVNLSASIGTLVDNNDGTWSWSYTGTDDLATQTVTITANDEDGGSAIATFNLTVNNAAPSVTVHAAAVTINEGQSGTNSGTYADVPADTVTLSASIGTLIDNNDGTWSWSFSGPDDVATQTVIITASDEDGGSTMATFNLTVNNVAPTVTVDNTSVTIDETQTATNSGTYSDVPADTVMITASVGTLTFSGAVWSWSYTSTDNLPTQTVTITASDEDGGSTIATFDLTVNNIDPTANAGGPYFTFDDTPITLNGSGFDAAGPADPLTFEWDLDNNGTFETIGQNAVFDPQALGFTGTQTRTVNLRVSDGDGGQAITTTTVELLGVGTALIGGVLHIVGSNANDIAIISKTSSTILVLATFNANNPVSFAEPSVTEIRVRLRDGHDIVVTTPNVTTLMTIDGGNGNDLLTGGGGRNVIQGGMGHDVLHGASGDDVLLGGGGNDDIFGGSGNDVLVGGDGNDILNGGTGRDVIIGSQDEDTLQGGNDEDILIGGFTSHDANVAALDAIMAIWGSSTSLNARIATLTGSGGLLEAGVTVFDDGDDDTIHGNAGRDLVFGDTNPWDGAFDTIQLHPLQDALVAVN